MNVYVHVCVCVCCLHVRARVCMYYNLCINFHTCIHTSLYSGGIIGLELCLLAKFAARKDEVCLSCVCNVQDSSSWSLLLVVLVASGLFFQWK